MASDANSSSWRERTNRGLDKLAIWGAAHSSSAWFTCILIGSLAGIASAAAMAWASGYSPWATGATCLGAGITCLAFAMARTTWTGEERYSFHTYFIVVVGASVTILMATHAPVLVYMDFVMLALAIAHTSGRIGCLFVGCCHGKPHAWGISYTIDHVASGFPRSYSGIRLFPVQAVESVAGVFLTAGLVALVVLDSPPGAAATAYVLGYASVRFILEFFRGDFGRMQYHDLSEAQWMSIVFIATVVAAAVLDILPIHAGMVGTALLVALAAYVLVRTDGDAAEQRLEHADHLLELAEAVEDVLCDASPSAGIRVSQTSLGIRISGGLCVSDNWNGVHIAISRSDEILDEEIAARVASRILRLRRQRSDSRLLRGHQAGIYHLLVRE